MTSRAGTELLVAAVAAAVSVFAVLFLVAFNGLIIHNNARSADGIAKSAIIDQLYDDVPNTQFQDKATEYLKAAGYQVDLYMTKDITVDFYKKLPSVGYKFIVIRSHSGTSPTSDQKIENSLGIFTGEKYVDSQYTLEQIFGLVQKSRTFTEEYTAKVERGPTEMSIVSSDSKTYFSIGSKFIDESMVGKFPDSIVIIGGCNSLENTSLADSLHRRGASLIIGWNRPVGAGLNDVAVLEVLKHMLLDKANAKDAIRAATQIHGPDPVYSAVLKYYPIE